jgi:hypothetical protein
MPKEVKMFACIHCSKKLLKTEKGMIAHEDVCFHNPENKYPCWGCKFRTTIEVSITLGEEERTAEVHYCTKNKIQIHNEVCEKRGLDESGRFENSIKINQCNNREEKKFNDE